MTYKVIAFLGDSITNGYFDETGIGWAGRLIQKLNADKPYSYYHNNYAVSGDRIFDIWHRLCADVILRQPDILIISVGLNDVQRLGSTDAPTSVSEELREDFWERIMEKAKVNIPQTFICSVAPVNETKMPSLNPIGKLRYYLNKDVAQYNDWLKTKCQEAQIPFIDLRSVFKNPVADHLLHDDGFHFSTLGQEKTAVAVYKFLKEQGV